MSMRILNTFVLFLPLTEKGTSMLRCAAIEVGKTDRSSVKGNCSAAKGKLQRGGTG
jgi:hypothetical protein